MKLEVHESQQKKGLMGGIAFKCTMQLVLTPEERMKVDKYKLGKKQIDFDSKRDYVWGGKKGYTVNELIQGVSFESKNLSEYNDFQNAVAAMAENVKGYIEVATDVTGGKKVIEI